MNHKLHPNANARSRASRNKQRRLSITYLFIKNFFLALAPLQLRAATLPLHIFALLFFVLPFSSSAQTIAGGTLHSLAVCNNNTGRAWGGNGGALGNGTNTDSNVPVQVSSLTGITAIAGGGGHSLALKNDGTVRAWGFNANGQLGNGTNADSNVPVQVSGLTGITAIAAGKFYSLALKNDGTVWAWGYNFYGQLGNGTNTNSNVPVQVSGLTGITAIAGAIYHSLALKNDGTVWAWGGNFSGQLGNGTLTDNNIPVQVHGPGNVGFLGGITAIAGGGEHSLALKNDGMVWAWGNNSSGELGNGTNPNSNVPVQVHGPGNVGFLAGITAIAAGSGHSLALKDDGAVWAWGYNGSGALGNGTNTNSNVPVQVSSLTGITAIGGGDGHSLALKNDGTVRAWGLNNYGQLGNGNNADSNVPVQVSGLCPVLNATGASTVLGNISTRLRVETGDNALIGGFIVTGSQPKKVIVRAIGPSLPLAGKLVNPTLELRNGSGTLINSNDDWRSTQEAEIIATTIPPTNDLESAIVATLPANNAAYTAIVRGVNNGTGIGLVEAYDLDRSVDSKLANISTRGLVQTSDNVLIAGTIVLGQTSQNVIVRAIGPSLSVPGKLADPTLELRDANGALVRSNDNWRTGGQEAEIIATTIPPTNDLESAIVETLPANGASYTAIVRGVNNTTGIAVVEVYALN